MSLLNNFETVAGSIEVVCPYDRWPNELMRLISEASGDVWNEVMRHIHDNPQDAHFVGKRFNQTPLHTACTRYPPFAPVEALLREAPEATSVQNRDGETPLHFAAWGASERVQQALISAGPGAITMSDKYGDTPLHIAVKMGGTYQVLRMMVESSPATIGKPNAKGMTPFSMLPRSYIKAEQVEDLKDEEFASDWEKSLLFLQAFNQVDHLLHCAAVNPFCPLALLKTIVRFYASAALDLNSEGQTPLLLAARAPVCQEPPSWDEDGIRDDDDDDDDEEERSSGELMDADTVSDQSEYSKCYECSQRHSDSVESSVIQLILNCDRRAASVSDPSGRLPLVIAIVNSKTWEGGIRNLAMAAPRALQTHDPATNFLPFQLGAIHSDITTLYHLIRSSPQNLFSGRREFEVQEHARKRRASRTEPPDCERSHKRSPMR